jgi:hypothetical protein
MGEKFHSEELCDLYCSLIIIIIINIIIIRVIKSRRMRWVGHVERVRVKINACRIVTGKPEGKRQSERPRGR